MKHRRMALLAALVIAGCGGGLGELVAIVPIVGPIGGAWQVDEDPDTPQLDPRLGETFDVNPDNNVAYLSESKYTLSGRFESASGPCTGDVEVVGEADDDRLVLRREDNDAVCLDARFVDLRTLEAEDGTVYRNTSVQVNLTRHEWVNADDDRQRVKFTRADDDPSADAPLEGCSRVAGGAPSQIGGALQPFSEANPSAPRIVNFSIGSTDYGTGVFRGASEIEFDSPKLKLRRVRAGATPVTC